MKIPKRPKIGARVSYYGGKIEGEVIAYDKGFKYAPWKVRWDDGSTARYAFYELQCQAPLGPEPYEEWFL